jgi:hypothetical protein
MQKEWHTATKHLKKKKKKVPYLGSGRVQDRPVGKWKQGGGVEGGGGRGLGALLDEASSSLARILSIQFERLFNRQESESPWNLVELVHFLIYVPVILSFYFPSPATPPPLLHCPGRSF